MEALIFDCDGVLVDTEKDGHRVAFNETFQMKGINAHWNEELYGRLLQVTGGKERMHSYFENSGWPPGTSDKKNLLAELHRLKTQIFMQIIEEGRLPLRTGIARLVDEAIEKGITLAVCSTSHERAVSLIVEKMLGSARRKYFSGIFAGDVVSRKKPDPGIYLLAAQKLQLNPQRCVVVEDSRNGLLAAKEANMHCVITKSSYTRYEDFTEADAVFDELGDSPLEQVSLQSLMELI